MTPEKLLIGRPLLSHLGVETATLLDQNEQVLHGQDCATMGNPTSFVRRITLHRIRTSPNKKDENQPDEVVENTTDGISDMIAADATANDTSNVGNDCVTKITITVPFVPRMVEPIICGSSTNFTQTGNSSQVEEKGTGTSLAVIRPRKNYFRVRNEKDSFPDQSLLDEIDQSKEINNSKSIEGLINKVTKSDIPQQYVKQFIDLIYKNQDVFRVQLSAGPPTEIPPLKIELRADAKPVKVKLQNYSPSQREFLSNFVNSLVQHGLVYSNPTASRVSNALLVPKPGQSIYRFIVDLRPVHNYTMRHQYPMPNVENELGRLSNAKYFANLDLSNGYWQLPLEKESQQLQSFITPDGIFTPTRVLHGTANAVSHLQSSLMNILPPSLQESILIWLDDILIFFQLFPD